MRSKFLIIIVILLFTKVSIAQETNISEEYKETIMEMFEVVGTNKIYKTMITGMFDMYKRQKSDVPTEFWNELEAEFLDSSIKDLNKLLIPIYHKHFTIEDLKIVVDFYKSETGQKFVSKTPFIMQEAMEIGEQWGKGIGEKVMKKLENKGY